MESVGIVGLIIVFTVIVLIDQPKIAIQARGKKFAAVYYTVLVLGLVLSILDVFNAIPDYFKVVINFYGKLFGQQ